MDVYRLYNSLSNIICIFNKDIDELTIKDQLVYEDPLAILDLSDLKIINTKLYMINNPKLTNLYVSGGGSDNITKTEKEIQKAKNKAEKELKKARKKDEKLMKKITKEIDKKKKTDKEEGAILDRMKNVNVDSIDKDIADVKASDGECNDASKDIFILVIKIVMVILLIICLPIVPFILVSYYSFKRLNAKIDEAVFIL